MGCLTKSDDKSVVLGKKHGKIYIAVSSALFLLALERPPCPWEEGNCQHVPLLDSECFSFDFSPSLAPLFFFGFVFFIRSNFNIYGQ